MAKKKSDVLMHEAQRLDAFVGITNVLNEKGLEWGDMSQVHKMRISDYIHAVVDMWDEVGNTNGFKFTHNLTKAAYEWFKTDYAQIIGLSHRITVLNKIPFANTKKVTLVYA
jgi:hypothetical protein